MKRPWLVFAFLPVWSALLILLLRSPAQITAGVLWAGYGLLAASLVLQLFLMALPWSQNLLPSVLQKRKLFADFITEIPKLRDIETFANRLAQVLKETFRSERVIVLAELYGKKGYCLWDGTHPCQSVPEAVAVALPLTQTISGVVSKAQAALPEFCGAGLAGLFESLGAEVIMPLTHGGTFVGLLALGPRRKRYGLWETEFLKHMLPVITLAMNNSHLFGYVDSLSRELWEMNRGLDQKVRDRTQALENALERVRKMNEEQSNFFAMASHNLGTPLTAIKASAMIMMGRHPELDPELSNIILENLHRLEVLLHSVLEISMIESNRLDLMHEACDVPELVREVSDQIAPLYAGKSVTWELEFADDVRPLQAADKARVKMVLYHLLSNACKFARASALVRVWVRPADPAALKRYFRWAEAVPHKDYLEISVRDNGEGIAESDLPNIFNKFHQVPGSAQRYQGIGLGLHLAKRIIEYHGGDIRVESRVGVGTTFHFVLPVSE